MSLPKGGRLANVGLCFAAAEIGLFRGMAMLRPVDATPVQQWGNRDPRPNQRHGSAPEWPVALAQISKALPEDFPAPAFAVQPPIRERSKRV